MTEETNKDNLTIWNALKRPPKNALKTIGFGALKGKSDIDPMWRVYAMTEQFGPCGIGWKFEIDKVWCEPAPKDQIFSFAKVLVYTKTLDDTWSEPVPGIGGNMLVQLAKGEPKENDEGYKMAVTDALGTALKMIGVAADIYMGKFDGLKYCDETDDNFITGPELEQIKSLLKETGSDEKAFLSFVKARSLDEIPSGSLKKIMTALNKKKTRQPGEEG